MRARGRRGKGLCQVGGRVRERAFLRFNMGKCTTRRHVLRCLSLSPSGIYCAAVRICKLRSCASGEERVWARSSGRRRVDVEERVSVWYLWIFLAPVFTAVSHSSGDRMG